MTSHTTSTSKKITIHQPAFFPWYPFFEKLESADCFVFLTECQYRKNGYQNRFNIGEKWYTMSAKKGLIPINQKKYANPYYDWLKIKKSLNNEYGEILKEFDDCISEDLCRTNISIIKKICAILDIRTTLLMDFKTEKDGTERLVEICSKNSATCYIAGSSGKNYLETDKFDNLNIRIDYQDLNVCKKIPILQAIKEMQQ